MTMMQPREAYALLASDYDCAPNALIALEERTMSPLLPQLCGKTTLDIAAGTGRWATKCAARGARVIALDFCREMLRRSTVPAVEADATLLPVADACADIAICSFALGYAPSMFRELARVVRRGGTILASDIHPNALRRGWTRTFRHGGELIEVAHLSYSLEDLRAPGLRLKTFLEPRLGLPERTIFEAAGCPERFAEASRQPAIFVAHWIRA